MRVPVHICLRRTDIEQRCAVHAGALYRIGWSVDCLPNQWYCNQSISYPNIFPESLEVQDPIEATMGPTVLRPSLKRRSVTCRRCHGFFFLPRGTPLSPLTVSRIAYRHTPASPCSLYGNGKVMT
jgi:hypothetical protein